MDWKQFFSSLVENLAWPITVVAIIFIFRLEVGKLISKIARLKYKDLELDFNKVQQQVEALQHEEEPTMPSNESAGSSSLEEQIMDSIEKAPAAAILLAWSSVETAIASAVSRLSISSESPSLRSPLHNIDVLSKYSSIPKNNVDLLHDMRRLRNKISHEHGSLLDISQEQAKSYADAAFVLVQHLKHLKVKS